MSTKLPGILLLIVLATAGCAAPLAPAEGSANEAASGNLGGAPGVTVTSVFPGDYDWSGPEARVLEPGPFALIPPERVVIPSALDGEDILMGIHRPDTSERVPVLVMAGPYFSFTGGFGDVTARGDDASGPTHWSAHVHNFVPHGYAVVAVAVRGTGGSGGCNDLMGPKEAADLDQAIAWLGEQPWSTGKIGMAGTSYDGSTPWTVAATGNPYLKTIVPAAGVSDLYNLVSRNGTSEPRGPAVLNALYFGQNAAADTALPAQRMQRVACPEGAEGIVAGARTGIDGSDATGYWQARDRRAAILENYRGSLFVIHGLTDYNVPPTQSIPLADELERAGLRVKQLYGQWGHNYPGIVGSDGLNALHRVDYAELLLRWLDRELKGLDVDTGAPVQVADSAGRWRNEAHYPPRDVAWRTLHLAQGTLSDAPPDERTTFTLRRETIGDYCAGRPLAGEAADFTLGVAEDELLLAGQPRAHLAVTPDGPGGLLSAYLCKRASDGVVAFLAHADINLAHADGAREPRAVEPGATIQVRMQMDPLDVAVRAGEEVFLRVAFPSKFYVGTPGASTSIALEVGHDVPSILELPVLARAPAVYFEPPRPPS